jgi:hypothetical protein
MHRTSPKSDSRKFAVASDRAEQGSGLRARYGGASSGSERRDLVAFVAPLCSKALRLVTLQLPEKFSPIGPGLCQLRRHGVLRSSHSPGPMRQGFLCTRGRFVVCPT